MAQVLAAIWGASYGQMLNDLDRHVESLSIAADSQRLIEGALADLCENGGPETVATVESQRLARQLETARARKLLKSNS